MRCARRSLLAAGLMLLGSSWCDSARGQAADAALKDRVAQLVDKLDSPKVEARDAAEKALNGLGPKALSLLPDPAKSKNAEVKMRLERIKKSLSDDSDTSNLGASRVTIQVKGIRLSEAIKQLQVQSGNVITDLRDEGNNSSFDLDLKDLPFFEALDQVAKKAEIVPNFFTGDGSVGLMAGGGSDADGAAAMMSYAQSPFLLYSGPFRVVLKQFTEGITFGGQATANAQFEVAWEPRLRPMLMALKAEDVKILDDQGKTVTPTVMEESSNVVLRPENPAAEVNINMNAPSRDAKKIASFKVKADVTIPAGLKAFKFPSLAAENVKLSQGDVSVTLESTEVDEQAWKVNIEVAYPGEGPAFESYRQGLFNNRLWLQKSDGSRFEHNGGFSNTASDAGKLGFEYIFVDAPGKPADYQLVYETPSKVLTIPLEFEFKDVPLPGSQPPPEVKEKPKP